MSIPTTSSDLSGQLKKASEAAEACKVCGDENGKVHYGIVTCFGCKGFFRRTVKRQIEYTCRKSGNCTVDKLERNACRHCRYKKCLEVGMDPKAVRPDRDSTQRANLGRPKKKAPEEEREVGAGDGCMEPKEVYPLSLPSVRAIFSNINLLQGKRNEMRYDSIREVIEPELPRILHRRIIAMIDWTYQLFELMDYKNYEDAVELVRYGFAPMTVFTFCSNTARMTKRLDIISLNTFGYIQRDSYKNHFANNLAERCLDDLIEPLREFSLQEEEISLLKSIIALNPLIKGLSREGKAEILKLRNRLYETLYYVSRELHPNETASSRFGNLLMFMPIVMRIGETLVENVMSLYKQCKIGDMLLVDVLKGMKIKHYEPTPNVEPMPKDDDDDDVICVSPQRTPTSSSSSTTKSPGSSSSNAQTPSSSCKGELRHNSLKSPPEITAAQSSAPIAIQAHPNLAPSSSMPHDVLDTDLELALDYINDTSQIPNFNNPNFPQVQATPVHTNVQQLSRRSSLPYELDGHYSGPPTSSHNKSPSFFYSNQADTSYHPNQYQTQQTNYSNNTRHRPYYTIGKTSYQIPQKQMTNLQSDAQKNPTPGISNSGVYEIHYSMDNQHSEHNANEYQTMNQPVTTTTGQYFGDSEYTWSFNSPITQSNPQIPMVHAAAGANSHNSAIDYNCPQNSDFCFSPRKIIHGIFALRRGDEPGTGSRQQTMRTLILLGLVLAVTLCFVKADEPAKETGVEAAKPLEISESRDSGVIRTFKSRAARAKKAAKLRRARAIKARKARALRARKARLARLARWRKARAARLAKWRKARAVRRTKAIKARKFAQKRKQLRLKALRAKRAKAARFAKARRVAHRRKLLAKRKAAAHHRKARKANRKAHH
ncbi:hypothetical protein WR25_09554 [Diploscapter pachys]|uniref:Nuclear receptor domain-containing protein n=1 Tax=Diploscapter pachys TaxID=2018661 RepID=A0A2A2KXD9_9BILA|nr:hypothetical protein WR25_09554 [Diploscapter pachys]